MNALKISALSATMLFSAVAFAQGNTTGAPATGGAPEQTTTTAAPTPTKKMTKKEAKKECKTEGHTKGKDLKECIKTKMAG